MIRNFILERNIQNVYHFTREDNLESILNMGIVPRTELENKNIHYIYNDGYRLDGFTNANCCSISFPNYKMFFKYRNENPDVNWAVIELSSDILYNKNCYFCKGNAASSLVRETPIQLKQGIIGLRNMFSEREGQFTREQMGLPNHYSTDPQAEVLIFDTIEVDYFKRIIFDNETTANKFRNKYKTKFQFVVDTNFFYARNDYHFWR